MIGRWIYRLAGAIGAALMLQGGCASTGTIVQDRAVEVFKPLLVPCVAGPRPAQVKPLRDDVPPADWAALDVKQKAARVGGKGLERQTYGEKLDAATGACPEVR